jgi:predicted phage terminase large subunit-like protein
MEKEEVIKLLQESKASLLLKLANEAKDDLYFMSNEILDYQLMSESVHRPLTAVLQSLYRPSEEYLSQIPTENLNISDENRRDWGIFENNLSMNDLKKKFRLILMPRGTFKSTISTISFPLQLLLINPNIRILIDSETFDKSRAFMSEIRGHLESNEKYRELFKCLHGIYPDSKKGTEKWGDTEINVSARTKKAKEPNLSCSGVGVTKVGMHYDVIISDDLHSEKNVTNKEQIQQVIDHYKLNLSLLEPDGAMIVIGTRWDYLDLYQYIIDNELHRFCVYAQQAEKAGGRLLFPERLTKEFLESQRMSQGSSIYSMQYQNLPIDDETATFKHSLMRRVDESFVKDRPINWFLMVDPAISQESTADDTAFVVAGFDQQRNIYVRHITYGKFTPSEIVNQVFYLYEQYKPRAVSIETVAFQKTLQYAINDMMRERGWWIPLKEVKRKTNQSKESRIRGLQPYYEFGHIYHMNTCKGVDELEYQLIHFPKGRKDDIIDALADVLEVGYPPDTRIKAESLQDRQTKKKLLRSLSKPRSRITGW